MNTARGIVGKQSLAASVNSEIELQSQPMDLASKNLSNSPSVANVSSIQNRLVGEASKSIYLVKPTTTSGPTFSGSGIAPAPPLPTIVQQGSVPVAVSLPAPITMTKFQAAIRPGTTVTLAPRVIPTTLVTTAGNYSGIPVTGSHVPKGPAAVASIAIPRSAVSNAALIRPAPVVVVNSASVSQVTGFPVVNRNIRPPTVTVRPSIVDTTGTLPGTWVSVTPASSAAQSISSLLGSSTYKATANVTGAVKNASGGLHKPAPVLTTPITSAVSIIGPSKTPVTAASSNITLLSVRGSTNPMTGVRSNTSLSSAAVTIGPRMGPDSMKPNPVILQNVAHRSPSMTITSTSTVQGVEKHLVKTVPAVLVPSSTNNLTRPTTGSGTNSQIQITSRSSVQSASTASATSASSVITAANSGQHIVLAGLKNIAPISNMTAVGKVGQQGIAVQFPQVSVSSVAKLGSSTLTTTNSRTGSGALPIVTVASSVVTSGKTYLQASPAIIPVAKVLPQPSGTASAGFPSKKGIEISAAASNMPVASASSDAHLLLAASSSMNSVGTVQPSVYVHPASRPAPVSGIASSVDSSGSVLHAAHPANQPITPSKLGASPRPSILRKRDSDGIPLKAQKNLSATLASMTSASVTTSASTSLPAVPAVSPPSPRPRMELALTPGGPNGDSSRSSSGGSTTLSASSSPGIPADVDENNPAVNTAASSASILGKALSSIQVKQEVENAETSGAIASLMRMSTAAHVVAPPAEMSPRKKPRKQQLLGQELQEVRSSDDEMHHPPSVKQEAKHEMHIKTEVKDAVTVVKRPRVSLMSSYRQTWKARNQHFTRYTDMKLKDERRPTVTDLANQKHIMQKVHGWKVFHLSAQIEEMAYSESQVYDRLNAVLGIMENLGNEKCIDRDLMRVNELIKGNIQRSKVIRDGLQDSKNQVQKIFEHKPRAEEIISRYMYKRLSKKREKL